MGTPFMPPSDGYVPRLAATSPAPESEWGGNNSNGKKLAVQPMKRTFPCYGEQVFQLTPVSVKVLYTFDEKSITNCLARKLETIHCRTAYLDESTQIGVVELKTCLAVVVSASPEIVANLGQDYTVYSYDYSEYDIPLVGQGMLSWTLAANSSRSQDSLRKVITGRVSDGLRNLFSDVTEKTLEVKLRLIPMPTIQQSEFLDSIKKYREISKMMPGEFDAQAWTQFLQANPNILNTPDSGRMQSPLMGPQRDIGLQQVQQLVRDSASQPPPRRPYSRQNSFASNVGQNQQRPVSPATSVQSSSNAPKGRKNSNRNNAGSRTASRASNRPLPKDNKARSNSIDLTSDTEPSDGPARKRAKVTQASNWQGNGFGQQPDSLRVAASTAASVRVFQPTAIRPTPQGANSLQEPPRAPTPVPRGSQGLRPLLPAIKSSLGKHSFLVDNSTPYLSPYVSSENVAQPEMTSPEDSRSVNMSVCNTPAAQELTSSPPVIQGLTPNASSPTLPTLPHDFTSDFPIEDFDSAWDAQIDDFFMDNTDRHLDGFEMDFTSALDRQDSLLPDHAHGQIVSEQRIADEHISEPQVTQQPMAQPTNEQSNQVTEVEDPFLEIRGGSQPNARAPQAELVDLGENRPSIGRTASVGTFEPPHIPPSESIRPSANALHRSQTWCGDLLEHETSDLQPGTEGLVAPVRRPVSRSASGAKRKKQIQSKLDANIAEGKMPSFCYNCGCIDTATWRKGSVKTMFGNCKAIKLPREPKNAPAGSVISVEVLEKDVNGICTQFRMFKKSLLPEDQDQGFEDFLLCNPCGLWFHQGKGMRPQHLWKQGHDRNPDQNIGIEKTSRRGSSASKSTSGKSQASSFQCSPPLDGTFPSDIRFNSIPNSNQKPPIYRRKRPTMYPAIQTQSDGLTAQNHSSMAPQRASQSSPPNLARYSGPGSKAVPIALDDLTPKPVRRALFPSPPKPSPTAAHDQPPLSEKDINSLETTPRRSKRLYEKDHQHDRAASPSPTSRNPMRNDTNDFESLFNDFPIVPPSRSQSPFPTSQQSTLNNPFKTPTKPASSAKFSSGPIGGEDPSLLKTPPKQLTPGGFFSLAAKALLRTPEGVRRSPRNHPGTPSKSGGKGAVEYREDGSVLTPFSKHLEEMMESMGRGSPGLFLDWGE